MKRGLKIKSYLGIFIAFFAVLLYSFVLVDYLNNTIEYKKVYHIGSEGVKWKYQSGQNFIIGNIVLIGLGILYIVANLFCLLKFQKSKVLRIILLCFEICWFIWVVWSLYSWYLIGFDH